MKVTLRSTDLTREVKGIRMRVWEGETEQGIRCYALIPIIAADARDDQSEFLHELDTYHQPASPEAKNCFDPRFVL